MDCPESESPTSSRNSTTRRLLIVILGLLTLATTACHRANDGDTGSIYYERYDPNTGIHGFWRVDPVTGELTLLADHRVANGEISPDGRWMAWYLGSGDSQTVMVMDTQTGQEVVAGHDFLHAGIRWSLDSRLLVIEHPQDWEPLNSEPWVDGESRYVLFDPATGKTVPARWHAPFLPPEGTVRYAPTLDCAAQVVWARSPDKHKLTVICEGRDQPALLLTDEWYGGPAWSVNGQHLAFMSRQEEREFDVNWLNTWDRKTDTMYRVQLTASLSNLRWSPDGGWIAFLGENLVPCVFNVASEDVNCVAELVGLGHWAPNSRAMILANCPSEARQQDRCSIIHPDALFIVSVPEGEITILRDDVMAVSQDPLWGK